MSIIKEESHEASEQLYVPDHYHADDSVENKVIYALGQIGKGTAADVGIKISEVDTSIEPGGFSASAEPILQQLNQKGLISVSHEDDKTYYMLYKWR